MRRYKKIKNDYQLAQERRKQQWQRFDEFMASQGWEKRHLFMRGNQWTKAEDTIVHCAKGWLLNGVEISYEHMTRFLLLPDDISLIEE